MAATYEPIASTTLGSNAASYTFSSIPGGFTDLILVSEGQNNSTNLNGIGAYVNGDTSSNYSGALLYGNGSSALSERYSNVSVLGIGLLGPSNGQRAVNVTHFLSYSNANVYKTVLSSRSYAPGQVSRFVGLWRSTAAITSITVREYNGTVDLLSGSTFSLYGIKAA